MRSADAVTTSGKTSASFNVTVACGGSHNLQAIYAGDSNYADVHLGLGGGERLEGRHGHDA